jgi:alkaline phosphatase D
MLVRFIFLALLGLLPWLDATAQLPRHDPNDYPLYLEENRLQPYKPILSPQLDTFQFQFGSCALYLPKWNEKRFKIFETMRLQKAHFMIWLGDNLYFINKKDWSSSQGMRRKYEQQRTAPHYKAFLESRPYVAIWDDHEYGPNNSDGSWAMKDTALMLFNEYWPNTLRSPSLGPGIYNQFTLEDAQFFLLDGRYHCQKWEHMFGPQQMAWLKAELKASTATFKFICSGSQIINNGSGSENLGRYPKEYNELMQFLKDEKITGVIFLSGDRHFAEISKLERPGTYPLIDITSSGLTSPYFPTDNDNDYRVPGTMYKKNNFGRATITGTGDDRTCHFELFNRHGKLIWEYKVKAGELK